MHGPFCHICGQENIVTRQNFFSLTKHFIYDVFHFDGKFFDTLKYLLIRPGYIPRQFIEGKRKSYLDPIRMYLFTSAFFFIVFFTVKDPKAAFVDEEIRDKITLSRNERFLLATELYRTVDDSISRVKLDMVLDTTKSIRLVKVPDNARVIPDSTVRWQGSDYFFKVGKNNTFIDSTDTGFLSKSIRKKWQTYRRQYGEDTGAIMSDLGDSFMHKFPYVLFVSLPLFALILKLLYVRKKNMLYSDHSVFTLYHYIFSFIILLFYFLLDAMERWTGLSVFNVLGLIVLAFGGIYLFIAMKKFYGQSVGKTLLKFILLNFLGFIVLILIMFAFLIFSIFQF